MKNLKSTLLYGVIVILLFFPFWLPDEMVYIKKQPENIYIPFAYAWMYFSSFLMLIFMFIGVVAFSEWIFPKQTKKPIELSEFHITLQVAIVIIVMVLCGLFYYIFKT